MRKLTVIDLFAGAGGLSEGFLETRKFKFLAHVEWETPMVLTLRNNLIKRWGYTPKNAKRSVIKFDIQKTEELLYGKWKKETSKLYSKINDPIYEKKGLIGCLGKNRVDIIIGGPPCQAYSIAGRAQDPYSMKNDYRNYLFESFAKVVKELNPKIFVFENVPGILSAKPGDKLVIDRIYEYFNKIGYIIRKPNLLKKSIYSASDYLVPQERHRVIIFGIKKGCEYNLEELYDSLNQQKKKKSITVKDAIGDLPKFIPLDTPYKIGRKNYSHKLIGNNVVSRLHQPRYNNLRDIAAFKEWLSNRMNYLPTKDKLEFYKKITGHTTNHNKYRNLEWNRPSPTIVSHLYKDGFMFIHPDIKQLRTITMYEASLLQSFPKDYEFLGSSAYVFKMIGNAVPVMFAKSIALSIIKIWEKKHD